MCGIVLQTDGTHSHILWPSNPPLYLRHPCSHLLEAEGHAKRPAVMPSLVDYQGRSRRSQQSSQSHSLSRSSQSQNDHSEHSLSHSLSQQSQSQNDHSETAGSDVDGECVCERKGHTWPPRPPSPERSTAPPVATCAGSNRLFSTCQAARQRFGEKGSQNKALLFPLIPTAYIATVHLSSLPPSTHIEKEGVRLV